MATLTKPQTVYRRFLKIITSTCVVVFVAILALFEWQAYQQSVSALEVRLETLAATHALVVAEPTAQRDLHHVRVAGIGLLADPDLAYLTVTDADGNVLDHSGDIAPAHPRLVRHRRLSYVVKDEAREVGTLTLAFSTARLEDALLQRSVAAVALLTALLLAVLVSTRIAYRRTVGRPLAALTASIQTYQRTNVHEQVSVSIPDELGAVIETYNRMQETQATQRAAIDEHQQRLETEVANRTRALENELSEHARTSELLAKERHYLRVTLDSINDAVISLDAKGEVRFINPSAERLSGHSQTSAKGRRLADILDIRSRHGQTPMPEANSLHLVETPPREPWEAVLTAKDGIQNIVEVSVGPLRNETGLIGMGVFVRDVTESRRLAARLSYQAGHDPLTSLPNRREFERELTALHGETQGSRAQHALCFIDLDRFKIINDTCGHAAGDQLLRQIGDVLSQRLRRGDLVARLGGDEFALLLANCSLPQAREVAEKVRDDVEDFRFSWLGQHFKVGASIGVASLHSGSGDPDELLRKADAACFLAKESGRNKVHIHDDDDISVARRRGEMRWVHELERAMEEDRLEIFYQRIEPAVDTGQDRWAEMLVRVRTRDGELHSPSAFLPAAERYGLAPRLDQWLVDRCITWLETGASEALGVSRCSINLSGMTLGSERFDEFVTERLDASNLDPSRVCFEITETAAISNLVAARRLIDNLRDRGCQFALDDFGSGLSSFGYLRELPVDHLKIDGSFVRTIDRDGLDRELVRSINAIGHIMGLTTVAEYVESPEILRELRTIGVDYVQGYAIHRPSAAIAPAKGVVDARHSRIAAADFDQ